MDVIIGEFCGNTFQYIASLRRHINLKHNPVPNDNLTTSNNPTNSEIGFCDVCNLNVPTINWSHHLRTSLHKQLSSTQINDNLRCIRSAFRNRIETYLITNRYKECLDIIVFQQSIKEQGTNLLKDAQKTHINIKFNFEQFCNNVLIEENEAYCQIN